MQIPTALILGLLVVLCIAEGVRWAAYHHKALPLLENIMAKVSELTGILAQIHEQTNKIQTEVQALKDSLVNVQIPAEAQAHLDAISETLQAVDDINPDTTVPPADPENPNPPVNA